MGDNFNHQRIQLYGSTVNKHKISYTHIMLSWLSDIVDQQVRFLEAKGSGIVIPLFGITFSILGYFADVRVIGNGFDLFKNLVFSCVGMIAGICGAINMIVGTKSRIKKYTRETKEEHEKDKQKIA